jgi:GNAT superfamily N-acetyltransferase
MSILRTRAMARLPVDGHPAVLPLYQRSGLCFPLIRAVIEGLQRGWVWVDDPSSPASAFVVTGFGFACFLGAHDNGAFNALLREHLHQDGEETPRYLLWYAPPIDWRTWLDGRPEGAVRRRERVRLRLGQSEPEPPYVRHEESRPEGFRLSPLDPGLIPELDRLGLSVSTRFWSSAADLLQHGFGACLVANDDSVASVCYSSCLAGGLAEVDIATREEHRGRGFAGIVAREFVRQCTRRRIAPTWDCFTANEASLRLAVSLGFVETLRYPLYSFQIPLPVEQPFDSSLSP